MAWSDLRQNEKSPLQVWKENSDRMKINILMEMIQKIGLTKLQYPIAKAHIKNLLLHTDKHWVNYSIQYQMVRGQKGKTSYLSPERSQWRYIAQGKYPGILPVNLHWCPQPPPLQGSWSKCQDRVLGRFIYSNKVEETSSLGSWTLAF